jgi:hypothetical protein
MSRLLSPWLWGVAAAGMVVMVVRYRWKALWLFSWALFFLLHLIYKLKTGTLDLNADYFFLLALIALPAGLECVRTLFARLGHRRSYGVIALGVAAFCAIYSFHRASAWHDARWNYPDKFIQLTEVLKGIPASAALYVDQDLKLPGEPGVISRLLLLNLMRNPWKYCYSPRETEPKEMEYYLLTMDKAGQAAREGGVKVRDFQAYGWEGLVLYYFAPPQEEMRIEDAALSCLRNQGAGL